MITRYFVGQLFAHSITLQGSFCKVVTKKIDRELWTPAWQDGHIRNLAARDIDDSDYRFFRDIALGYVESDDYREISKEEYLIELIE